MKSDKQLQNLLESIINDIRKLIKVKATNEQLLAKVDFHILDLEAEDIKYNRIVIEESLENDEIDKLFEVLHDISNKKKSRKKMKEGRVRAQIYNILIKGLPKSLDVEQKNVLNTRFREITQHIDLNHIKIDCKYLETKKMKSFLRKRLQREENMYM